MELKAGMSSSTITPCTLLDTKTLSPQPNGPPGHIIGSGSWRSDKKGDMKTTGFWPTATSSATLPVHLVLLLVLPLLYLLQRSLSLLCQLLQSPFVYKWSPAPFPGHCSIHPTLLWPGDILPATPAGPRQVITIPGCSFHLLTAMGWPPG